MATPCVARTRHCRAPLQPVHGVFANTHLVAFLQTYKAGMLPEDFHQRVVDLEIKLEMKGVADDDQQLANISELMSLYSAAIEHYNR